MPAVFVHGVPETAAIWEPLVTELAVKEPVLLEMPGFGAPLPEGFLPTMHRLAAWLGDELAAIPGPVDVVSHDWGAFLALRVLGDNPENVRSLVTDGWDLTEDFRWHDLARVWQTPGEGETFMDDFVHGPVADRAAMLVAAGVPDAHAGDMAAQIDETMASTILVLYRSAVDMAREWGPGLDSVKVPTLVIDAMRDGFRGEDGPAALATRIGAARCGLPEQGHWWMLSDPLAAATAISEFWGALDR